VGLGPSSPTREVNHARRTIHDRGHLRPAVRRQGTTGPRRIPGRYRGATPDAYALYLRQFVAWCVDRHLALFSARRSDIEGYARTLQERGRARATVARRLCTVAGVYRYAEEEGLLAVSPAVHVRRPRLDYESHAVGVDRNEVGALLVAAGLGPAIDHSLPSLLALNGLPVSEATGANIEALGLERGHRTLTIVRKGGKIVTIPLVPRTARAIDRTVRERAQGPIFTAVDGSRLDRLGAARIVSAWPGGPESPSPSGRIPCVTLSSPQPLTLAYRSGMSKRPPPMPIPGPPCGTTGPGFPLTDMPLI
jgi:integrase